MPVPSPSLNLVPVGQTGLAQYGGHVYEEWHPKLSGRQWLKVAREMRDNSSTLSSAVRAMTTLIRGAPWYAEPADDSSRADTEAKWLETAMKDIDTPWQKLAGASVDDGCTFGFAPHEVIHKVRRGPHEKDPAFRSRFDDGRLGLRDIAVRAAETTYNWTFDENDQWTGWQQRPKSNPEIIFIPAEKMWLFRPDDHKNNPEGRALFRPAYRPYKLQTRLEDIEAVGIERDFVGIPTARIPRSYFGENVSADRVALRNDIFESLKHMQNNRLLAMVYPHSYDPETDKDSGFEFGLTTSGGRRSIDINPSIARYKRDQAMAFLAQFLFLGMEKVGSYSLSSDQTDLFAASLGCILDEIEDTINATVIAPLFQFNGVPESMWPRWKHGDIEKENLKAFADTMMAFVGAGLVTPGPSLEDFVRRKAELPERDDWADALTEDLDGGPPIDAPATGATMEDSALSGPQAAELRSTLEAVAAQRLPARAARALIRAAYPSVSEEAVSEMLAGVAPEPEAAPHVPPQPQGV